MKEIREKENKTSEREEKAVSEITLRNVCKSYDKEHYAVKDFNLEIHDNEFVIFVGPSGCGKFDYTSYDCGTGGNYERRTLD